MTRFMKTLWRIAGIIPGFVYIMSLSIFQPLNYFGVVREQFGQMIWIVLLSLSFIAIVPLYLWCSYCYARSLEKIPSSRLGVREHLRKEQPASLIILGVSFLISVAIVFYNIL